MPEENTRGKLARSIVSINHRDEAKEVWQVGTWTQLAAARDGIDGLCIALRVVLVSTPRYLQSD